MARTAGTGGTRSRTAQRGLLRLMLKLPALRGGLQILTARPSSFDDLLEAYEEACATLERLQQSGSRLDITMIEEYQSVCSDIEGDVIDHVLKRGSRVP